jgi:hypothetical protein
VTPEKLVGYWVDLVSSVMQRFEARERAMAATHAPDAPAEHFEAGVRYCYSAKIEIKTAESVVALLHEIVAPAATFVCDESCRHLSLGATAEQAKRYVDSLQARIAEVEEDHCRTPVAHPCYEDQLDELGVYQKWLERFEAL